MRNRLTAKTLVSETRADGIFPGDIGNKEREKNYHDVHEYDNEATSFKEGWDLPVKNKIEDKRDEMNLGIPKKMTAAEKMALCQKASFLAQLFLGDKAPDKVIQAQAKSFMKLGYEGCVDAIMRYAATEPAEEEKKDECAACGEQTACKAEEEAPIVEEEVKEEDVNDLAAPETTACKAEEEIPAEETEEAPAMEIDIEEAPEATDGILSNGDLEQAEADPELQKAFMPNAVDDDEIPAASVVQKTAKQGIKHLSAQPKLASVGALNGNDLAHVWDGLANPHLM